MNPLRLLSVWLVVLAAALFFVPTDSPAMIPRGGVISGGGGTGDPAIAPVGQWVEWTGATAGALIAQYPASSNDQTGCNNYEGANPAACGQNKAGSVSLTASSILGTTLTVGGITGLTTGSTALNNGDVISDVGGNILPGTYVASGGPLTGAGTVTVSQSQTVASETMVTNAPALQATNLNTTVNVNLPSIFGNSGAIADPGQGCNLVWQPGGHAASQSNGLVSLCLADVENASGPANWSLQQSPWLLYPASWGLSGTPSYIGSTVGSTYQTFSGTDFINGQNTNGVAGPIVVHQYNFTNVAPNGWAGLAVDGGASGGRNGADNIGAGIFVDDADYSIHGPIYVAPATVGSVNFKGLSFGYAPRFSSTTAAGGSSAFGPDGALYAVAPDDAPGPILGKLSCPFDGYQNSCTSIAWSVAGNGSGSGCWPDLEPALVINDPGNAGAFLYMVYGSATGCTGGGSGTTGSGHLEILTNVGGTTAYHNLTISGTIPSWIGPCTSGFNCEFKLAYDYDDGTILISDGSWHLAALTLTYSGGIYSVSSQDLSSTLGSSPPDPTTTSCASGGAASNVSLFYMNRKSYHMAVMGFCGRMFERTISQACPTGSALSPSPDGTIISSPTTCPVYDASGNAWTVTSIEPVSPQFYYQRQANFQINENGSDSGLRGYQIEINQTGKVYVHQAGDRLASWFDATNFQLPGPTSSSTHINHAIGTTPSNSWQSLAAAEFSGSITSGQTITIQNQTGVQYWLGDYGSIGRNSSPTSLTINCQSGVAMYGGAGENGEIFGLHGSASNLTVSNCDAGFNNALANNGPNTSAWTQAGAQNLTLSGDYFHDSDMCLLAGGNNGTITVTNTIFEHCGGDTGSGAASHNIYLSYPVGLIDNTVANFSGSSSYCMKDVDGLPTGVTGFELKERISQINFQNGTVAEPSQHGYTGCRQSTAWDSSCGGQVTIGGTSNGQGATIELGPDIEAGPQALIRFMAEIGGFDCPVQNYTVSASSNTYNNSTGSTTFTFTGSIPSGSVSGLKVIVTAITGTNCSGLINSGGLSQPSPWTITSVGTNTITFTAPSGLGCSAITGGTVYIPTYYTNNALLIQGSDSSHLVNLINDSPDKTVTVAYLYGHTSTAYATVSCTVKNANVIGFPAGLGTNCTDGGGNHFYATRAAAGIAPYPFLPAPT